MNKNNKLITAIYFLSSILILQLFVFSTNPERHDKLYLEEFKESYKVFAIPHPSSLVFAGEQVPIEDFEVRERFDRELLVNTYWQSQTMLFFKRANRWFPVIEPILESRGVPDDFKYLALIESGFQNVVSPAGATGFWQILSSTGRELGLEISSEVDERYHVEKSTEAACDFLLNAYDRFGSWALAAAAYNMGRTALVRQLNNQKVDNYYDLMLNEETSRYVFRILAVKHIFSNPQQAGYHFRKIDLYEPLDYEIITVDSTITDLPQFALDIGINYKLLREYNPWLRQYSLTNRRNKTYEIKIPANLQDKS